MESITLSVPNISCSHCTMRIKEALTHLEGVEEVDASVDSKEVTIEFEKPASYSQIVEKLVEINYPPVI